MKLRNMLGGNKDNQSPAGGGAFRGFKHSGTMQAERNHAKKKPNSEASESTIVKKKRGEYMELDIRHPGIKKAVKHRDAEPVKKQ